VLRPELPLRCVFATGTQTCSIFVDHYRFRKTGPRFPLAVVGCSSHPGRRYTLYPPGHFPYGREPFAPYSTSGELLLEAKTGKPPWEATIFAAAVDAARGEGWPEESRWDDPRCRRTQGSRLQLTGRLLGVHPQLDDRARERIATRLSVATMKLFTGAKSWVNGWKKRGEAILDVLFEIPSQVSLLDRLLTAGAVSGLWAGRLPQRWDTDQRTWIMPIQRHSEHPEHPDAAAHRERSPPPTNSPDAAVPELVVSSGS